MNAKALPPELFDLIANGLIEKLLKQDKRSHDRDLDESWLQYENFADYYASKKSLFIVTFSKVEMLIAAIIKGYVIGQLKGMLTSDEGYRLVERMVAEAIETNYVQLESALATKWPREFEDIQRKNAIKGLF